MTAPAPTYVGNVNNVILPSPKDLPIVGGLFWGPLDAAIPGATFDIDSAMKHLGFVAEDGIDESEDRPTTKIFAWGGDIVAAPQDSYSLTQVFTLYEFLNAEVAKAAYGEDNVSVTAATATTGTQMSIMVTSDVFNHHTWLLDTYGVGGKRVQKFVPFGQVTNKDTQTMNHKTVLAHRLTVECFPDTAGKYAYIRTDDGVFKRLMAAKKKADMPVSEFLKDHTLEEAVAAVDEIIADDEPPVIPLKMVKSNGAKPGAADYDWQDEYPGEEVYTFTSDGGLTIGLTKLNATTRKPKPGKLRTYHREGGMSVMWYFIELVSSKNSLKLQEELEEDDYTKMLRGWADFAGIELSE